MKDFFTKYMSGRYGTDQYNIFLVALSVVLMIIGGITGKNGVFGVLLMGVAVFFMIKAAMRLMSKNSEKCKKQNKNYLRQRDGIINGFRKIFFTIKEGRTHKFFLCPECSALLRLPRNEGAIEIKCSKCGHKFVRKT